MLKTSDTALAIIDVQGRLASIVHEKEELLRNLQILIGGAKALELPILWLEQYPKGLGPTVSEVADLLPGQKPLEKLCFSACGQEHFPEKLRESGRRQVLIAGIETHVCVYQTTRDLLDRGYHVEVVADAVSSRQPENKRIALARIRDEGAAVTSVEMALFELLRTAEAAQFKEIARLVK
jgi:nicotinamidase-related amidase